MPCSARLSPAAALRTLLPKHLLKTPSRTAPAQQEQSQTEKALALINTFATGDTDTARSLLSDGYIQHNLAYGTGADAFISSVEYLASADVKTTVNNIRAFEDGKIAEHWDVMETIADQSTWQNQNGKF